MLNIYKILLIHPRKNIEPATPINVTNNYRRLYFNLLQNLNEYNELLIYCENEEKMEEVRKSILDKLKTFIRLDTDGAGSTFGELAVFTEPWMNDYNLDSFEHAPTHELPDNLSITDAQRVAIPSGL